MKDILMTVFAIVLVLIVGYIGWAYYTWPCEKFADQFPYHRLPARCYE